jgi:hypothetical protein
MSVVVVNSLFPSMAFFRRSLLFVLWRVLRLVWLKFDLKGIRIL